MKYLPLNFKRLHIQSNFTYLLKSNKIGVYEIDRDKRQQKIIQERLVIKDFFLKVLNITKNNNVNNLIFKFFFYFFKFLISYNKYSDRFVKAFKLERLAPKL